MPLRDRGLENCADGEPGRMCPKDCQKSAALRTPCIIVSTAHVRRVVQFDAARHATTVGARRPCRGPLADPPTDRAARCHPLFYKELFQRRSVGRTQTDCDCSVGHNGIGRTGRPSQLTSITTFPTCCPPRTANHRDRHNQPACRPNSLPRVVANRQRLWRSFPDGKRRGRPRRN